jgi:choline dehydrogenase
MKSFDFIVVGGGTSGTVTAEKLIRNGHTVLLLEEGRRNSNPILAMPAGWIPMLDGSPYLKFFKSIPQPQLNNRQHDIAQAKILGGGSSINGMVYMRGKPSDYNKWVEETGDQRWSWDSLIENYKRLEKNQRLSGNFHGIEGPIDVSDPGYVAKGSDLYIKTMQKFGLPYNRDFNDGDQFGVGLMQYTIGNGKRSDTVSKLIKPIEGNKNLKINLNTIVTKIIIENKKAIGVETVSKGINEKFYGNEIILTAGALISPKILMHSGIGEENQLKKFGIKIKEKLDGVGKNLQDHHEVPFISKAKAGYGYYKQNKGLRMLRNGIQYLLFKSGPVTSNGVDCCSFLNPDNLEDKNDPKVKLYCVQIMYTDRDTKDIKPDHGVTLTPCIMNPKSRGEVTIKSSDPLDLPNINPNFLSNKDDIDTFVASLKLAREVINTKPLSDIIVEEILPGKDVKDDESLINYCKKMVKTNWHPVGTCKMGKDSDEMAVLNSKLQVKGIDNLRVFDVSMMPTIVAANTNAPAMAIADKATDIMLEGK